MLILEAAGPQLSAFDLNGNPVRYFGSQPNRDFTLALGSQRTYLDVAVDGASQIYLLYHNGAGSDPQDYHLDVYNADGTPLATKSAGVNVPHVAVCTTALACSRPTTNRSPTSGRAIPTLRLG